MVYIISSLNRWESALETGEFTTPALKTEGFIHACEKDQISGVLDRHFSGYEQLVILHIVEKRIKNILKREASHKGDLYPHIYGKLPLEAVENVKMIVKNEEGVWEEE